MEVAQPNAITEVREYEPPVEQERNQLHDEQHMQQIEDGSEVGSVETLKGIRYFLFSCRCVGMHMPKRNKCIYVIWASIVNFFVTLYLPIGFSVTYFIQRDELEIGNLLTSLQAAVNDYALSSKVIAIIFFLPRLLSCGRVLEKLDKRCRTKEEINIVKDYIQTSNRTIILFYICVYAYIISTTLSAGVFHRLPYNIYNPVVDANVHFYQAYFFEVTLVSVAVFQVVVVDAYPILFINIIRTHLNVLCIRIQNLNSNVTKSLEENLEELRMCIIDHQHIIEICNILAPVISTTIFLQFTVTAIILCVTMINLLIFPTDLPSFVASCFYMLTVIVEIFPSCYFAQCLIDESDRLHGIIFHSNWVHQNAGYKKLMIFFMHRSQATMEFTAGKLFPITLSNFLSIAKFSFTLYTFINKMGVKERFSPK